MTITSLEMLGRPVMTGKPNGLQVERVMRPSVGFYRSLYDSVGENWLWSDRRRWSDDHLASVVQHEAVELWVLQVDGRPAGYAELDGRQLHETELAYFGLKPAYIGRGLGPRLLHFAIEQAWRREIDRLWVHTCNFDHPAALGLYCRCGFVVFAEDTHWIDDPRRTGLIRPEAAPHIPGPGRTA